MIGTDFDIEFAPKVAYVVYWDNNYNVIRDTVMYAETLYPIPLTRAIEIFKPEFATGANVNFESVDGKFTDTIVFKL